MTYDRALMILRTSSKRDSKAYHAMNRNITVIDREEVRVILT